MGPETEPEMSTGVRELRFVGNGPCADVLERAQFWSASDLRAADLGDVSDNGPMRRVWSAIESCSHTPPSSSSSSSSPTSGVNWGRVGLAAYRSILRVQHGEPCFGVPAPFGCAITRDWMRDPVVAVPSGVSYERATIEAWIATHPGTPGTPNTLWAQGGIDPVTGEAWNTVGPGTPKAPLDPITGEAIVCVVPNKGLRDAIARYRPLEEGFCIPATAW